MRRVLKAVFAYTVGGLISLCSFKLSAPHKSRDDGGPFMFGFEDRIVNKTMATPHGTAEDKLRLIFHVGPGKMGSSSIQSVLINSVATLEDDGWANYRHIQLGTLNRCIARNICTYEMDHFRKFLRQAEQERRNIVLSTELWFSVSRELSWYQELFNQTAYDVTIVVAYRRYYNWLPSRYYQLNRFRCRPNPADRGRSSVNLGQGIPPLNAYLSNTPFDHPTVHKIARVSPYFDNIQVINIETGNLVHNFFCNILGAQKTCQKVQSSRPPSANQGKTLTFDRLAQHVIENGSVDNSKVERLMSDLKLKVPRHGQTECTSLAMILEMHDERHGKHVSNSDFPLICPPTNVTDRLFHVSAQAEHALFPGEFSRDDIWSDFSTKVNTTLFCDIDFQAVLSDETWQKLLERLRGAAMKDGK